MRFISDYLVPIGCEGIYEIDTGKWRTRKPVLDRERCIRCGLCFLYCPVFSIEKWGKEYQINYSYCKGCGICAVECPRDAIAMIPEKEV